MTDRAASMKRTLLRCFGRALIAAGLLLRATPAGAANKDTEAEELAKKAIYTDYLGTKFADAEKRLKQAIKLCGASACSAKVVARLHCDLGVVYIGGMNKVDDGKAQFADALKADSGVTPDPDLVSPEIEAAFAEVKGASGGGSKTKPDKPDKPDKPESGGGNGDLVHTPPSEQAVLTPLPLYAELPSGQTAAKVQLTYKPFGAPDWKTLGMKATGKGFGVEVPCAEIGSAVGDLSYYIQAFDDSSNLVSWSGGRGKPNKVAIRMSIEGDAPHLPGQSPPAKCPEKIDCPPEFPGCHDKDKPVCEPGSPDCVPEGPPARKNWISLAFQQDFVVLPGSSTTCAGGNGYDCFSPGSPPTYYSPIPYSGAGDVVKGGMSVSTTRILAGYDRALGNFTIGVRLGAAIRGGGPTTPGFRPFLPVHAEGRVAFWFGSDPFARVGFRPYLVAAGGLAQVDGSVGVIIYNSQADYMNNMKTSLTAWRKAGLGFVGGGVGALIAPGARHGPFLEIKFVEMLGLASPSLNLQLGYAFGL
jgi:hypothetical protein